MRLISDERIIRNINTGAESVAYTTVFESTERGKHKKCIEWFRRSEYRSFNEESLNALCAAAAERGISYGKLVNSTTPEQREEIVRRYMQQHSLKTKEKSAE